LRFAAASIALVGLLLLGSSCADNEESPFDPDADRTPPELTDFEIESRTPSGGVYALWAASEPVRAVVEYRLEESEQSRYAYSGQREWAEAGITKLVAVSSATTYEIVGVRLTDRAGNETITERDTTFTTGTVDLENLLTIAMIDVGWGDALYLRTPDSHPRHILIDAGHPGQDGLKVREFLEDSFGVNRLDFASMTHVHEDHIGGFYGDDFDGLDGLLLNRGGTGSPFSVGTFLDIRDKTPGTINGPYGDLEFAVDSLRALGKLGEWVFLGPGESSETHEALRWSDMLRVDLLASGKKDFLIPDYSLQEEIGSVQNNDSMVYRVQYGRFVLLLMGDGEFATEQYLQNNWPREFLRASVLKLGHHGSNDSNSERFIDVVQPIVGLIPNAISENPGVEHPYVLNRLRVRGIDYYASDRAIPNRDRAESGVRGDIVIVTDGEAFTVAPINLYYE
jgi:competence protein ComEC